MALGQIGRKIKKLFELNCSARMLAVSTSIGVFIGFSPYSGFHTLIALGVSFLFAMPLYPLLLGTCVTNPLTVVFIYAFCYKIGALIIGADHITIDWHDISFMDMISALKSILVPFFIGTHLVGLVFAIITYFVVHYIAVRYKQNI